MRRRIPRRRRRRRRSWAESARHNAHAPIGVRDEVDGVGAAGGAGGRRCGGPARAGRPGRRRRAARARARRGRRRQRARRQRQVGGEGRGGAGRRQRQAPVPTQARQPRVERGLALQARAQRAGAAPQPRSRVLPGARARRLSGERRRVWRSRSRGQRAWSQVVRLGVPGGLAGGPRHAAHRWAATSAHARLGRPALTGRGVTQTLDTQGRLQPQAAALYGRHGAHGRRSRQGARVGPPVRAGSAPAAAAAWPAGAARAAR